MLVGAVVRGMRKRGGGGGGGFLDETPQVPNVPFINYNVKDWHIYNFSFKNGIFSIYIYICVYHVNNWFLM